jgi:hypothetical protein
VGANAVPHHSEAIAASSQLYSASGEHEQLGVPVLKVTTRAANGPSPPLSSVASGELQAASVSTISPTSVARSRRRPDRGGKITVMAAGSDEIGVVGQAADRYSACANGGSTRTANGMVIS